MKNLDLNKYGVLEMNEKEMNLTNGGIHPIIIGLLLSFLDNFDDFKSGFKIGYSI